LGEVLDDLLPAVLEDGEVVFGEVVDELAGFVADSGQGVDDLNASGEDGVLVLRAQGQAGGGRKKELTSIGNARQLYSMT